jgi:hypothetical protein
MYLQDLLRQVIGFASQLQLPNHPNAIFGVEGADLAPDQGQAAGETAAVAFPILVVRHDFSSVLATMALCPSISPRIVICQSSCCLLRSRDSIGRRRPIREVDVVRLVRKFRTVLQWLATAPQRKLEGKYLWIREDMLSTSATEQGLRGPAPKVWGEASDRSSI